MKNEMFISDTTSVDNFIPTSIDGFNCPSCRIEVDITDIFVKKGNLGCVNCLK